MAVLSCEFAVTRSKKSPPIGLDGEKKTGSAAAKAIKKIEFAP
jgi:hypothetical protein